MIETRLQQIILAFLCAVALILIPVSGSVAWAQSSSQTGQTTDQSQRNTGTSPDTSTDQNLNNQSSDVNKSQSSDIDINKPTSSQSGTTSGSQSSTTQTPGNSQMNREQNTSGTSSTTTTRSTTSTSRSTSGTTRSNEPNQGGSSSDVNKQEALPRTAGELPVLAFIGLLSLMAAAGTRLAVKTNR